MTAPQMLPNLQGMPAYRPGRPAPIGPNGQSFKLSSNESPDGPLPAVLKVLAEAALRSNLYPEISGLPLRVALGERWSVPADDIAVGPGSVAVFKQIIQAYAGVGDEVVYAWRSFEAYPIMVQSLGAVSVKVPLAAGGRHDLEAMADAITPRTRIVVVCNPNNPTGTVVHRGELESFLDRVPENVLVVLDEAYREYVRDADVPDGIELYRRRSNVVVLRTFSKAYGLAGARVGFAIAPTPIAAALRATGIPFGLSAFGEAAGVAALEVEAELLAQVSEVVAERERVQARLVELGYAVPVSQANCLWLPVGTDTERLAAACEEAGIAARPFPGEGLRVTVAQQAANAAFLAVAEAFAAGSR